LLALCVSPSRTPMLSYLSSSSSSSAPSSTDVKTALAKMTAMSPMQAMSSSFTSRTKKKKNKSGFRGLVFDIAGVHRPVPRLVTRSKEYRAIMTASGQSFTTSASVPTYYGTSLTLATLLNYTEYTSLFDQYWIKEVEVWVEPSTLGGSNTNNPVWYSAVDLDDANTPTALATVASKQTAIASSTEAGHYHRWQPHVAVAEYTSGFTGYGNIPSTWADSVSPNIQYFGLKIAVPVDPGARAFNFTYRVSVWFREAGV
jgi:hypothetical protein